MPAPANIQSDRDLRYETIDLDSVLDAVAGRSAVSLLFLDPAVTIHSARNSWRIRAPSASVASGRSMPPQAR